LKVQVDLSVCQGHARCESICPEVFGTDAVEGRCVILLGDVPPRLEADARLAVRNCPEGALRIEEGMGGSER